MLLSIMEAVQEVSQFDPCHTSRCVCIPVEPLLCDLECCSQTDALIKAAAKILLLLQTRSKEEQLEELEIHIMKHAVC